MRPTRLPFLLLIPLLALALVACGGGSPAASKGDDGNGGQSTAASTEASAEASAEASTDNGGPGSSQDSGPASGDVEGVASDLEPPNASQVSQTNAQGTFWTVYSSSDSVDSLKSFYENAIPQTGMEIYSTTNAAGTYSWLFWRSDNESFGGSVTVGPATDGGNGSSVIVIVTDGS
jgi:hypothetical protein